jgi:hypothetical protein
LCNRSFVNLRNGARGVCRNNNDLSSKPQDKTVTLNVQ